MRATSGKSAPAADPAAILAEPANQAELAAAKDLMLAYARSLDFELCFQGFDEEMAAFPGVYAGPRGALLLASVAGQPAGVVALRPLDEGTCEMKRLYVSPAYRGMGLGRRLAEAAIAQARARGYRAMRLDTVPSMTAAIALYRALGFRPIPAYTHNPVPGALFFERELG
jgi:putative acetyltransferase